MPDCKSSNKDQNSLQLVEVTNASAVQKEYDVPI